MNKQNILWMCAAVLMASTAWAQQPTQQPAQQPSYSTDGTQDTYSYALPDSLAQQEESAQQVQAQKDDQQQRKLLIQNIRQLYHTQSNVLTP